MAVASILAAIWGWLRPARRITDARRLPESWEDTCSQCRAARGLLRSPPAGARLAASSSTMAADKIKVANPVVDLDGDEMTR